MPFHMARVYPRRASSSASSAASTATDISDERETFTVWMKSLVLNGNGLTVFNSKGQIIYRIDNYDTKSNREVFLMDLHGNVLCTLLRRKRGVSEQWNGHKFDGPSKFRRKIGEKPWFRVRKISHRFLGKKGFDCQVMVKTDDLREESRYQIKGLVKKSEFIITDDSATVIAEIKRKKVDSGVTLGEDVLWLVVEPCVDPSFVVALVAALGLICRRM